MTNIAPSNQWSAHVFHEAIPTAARDHLRRNAGITEPTPEQLTVAKDYVLLNWIENVAPAGVA